MRYAILSLDCFSCQSFLLHFEYCIKCDGRILLPGWCSSIGSEASVMIEDVIFIIILSFLAGSSMFRSERMLSRRSNLMFMSGCQLKPSPGDSTCVKDLLDMVCSLAFPFTAEHFLGFF